MRKALLLAACALVATGAFAAEPMKPSSETDIKKADAGATSAPNQGVIFQPEKSVSDGSVSVEGRRIDYQAVAGTIVVHPKDWDDTVQKERTASPAAKDLGDKAGLEAEASIFYVAYFKKGAPSADRPITFLYNGGPGSSSVWLHMGAFGPKRVVTKDDSHTPAAPYNLIDNAYSLIDASDIVFIDAPGTGFSRIAGKDKEKAFWGVDADAHAFGEFIKGFLSQYGRWNSPKYLFGESYGTPRSAVLVNNLETGDSIDFNGVILLSQILNFDLEGDFPQANPGTDEAYVVTVPTYAATAWYHNRIAGERPADLETYLKEVEHFADTDYAQALQLGSLLSATQRQTVAERMSHYIGIPAAYILKSDLRLNVGQFEKMLLDSQGLTTGRLDKRFSGPSLDPLSREAEYDPQSAAISSAYVSAFINYVRKDLKFGEGKTYKPEIDIGAKWSMDHQPPGAPFAVPGITNVMPDLASAMKQNPGLKVMVNGGYYDLATPFYEGWYEMHHLPIPATVQGNIEFKYYPSGHMVYAHEPSLKALHDNVADFIARTSGTK